jgi:hypothetical protein
MAVDPGPELALNNAVIHLTWALREINGTRTIDIDGWRGEGPAM